MTGQWVEVLRNSQDSLGNSWFARANRSNFLDVFFPQVAVELPTDGWLPRFARHGDIHQAPIDQTLVLRQNTWFTQRWVHNWDKKY